MSILRTIMLTAALGLALMPAVGQSAAPPMRVHVAHGSGLSTLKSETFDWKPSRDPIWKSNEIACWLDTAVVDQSSFSISCNSSGMRVESAANCTVNRSRDTAAFLFVAVGRDDSGNPKSAQNFHFWCAR